MILREKNSLTIFQGNLFLRNDYDQKAFQFLTAKINFHGNFTRDSLFEEMTLRKNQLECFRENCLWANGFATEKISMKIPEKNSQK